MPKRKSNRKTVATAAVKPVVTIDSDAYADTDTEIDKSENADKKSTTLPSLFRLSSRVASMKRRGENFTSSFDCLKHDC